MAIHRYWQVVAISIPGGGFLEVSEWQLWFAGSRVDASATISASSAPALGAVTTLQDNNLATSCRWTEAIAEAPGFWIRWDFGASSAAWKDVDAARIGGLNDGARYPSSFALQWSDDGVNWSTQATANNFVYPGNNALSTLISVPWGGAPGAGPSYLQYSAHADFAFGSGDFTIEGWLNCDNHKGILVASPGATNGIFLGVRDGKLFAAYGTTSAQSGVVEASTFHPAATQFHAAWVKRNGLLTIYQNGSPVASAAWPDVNTDATCSLFVGGASTSDITIDGHTAPWVFQGFLDDFRVEKGTARYSTSFIPPLAPHPDSVGSGLPPALGYQWRVGDPNGARIQWTGTAIEIYGSNNSLSFSSGSPIHVSQIGGLGALATADSIGLNQVAGAGYMASQDDVPAGVLVGGVAASVVANASNNFNARNDRNSAAITVPTIATDGTAVDHAIQTNGSADISFEWSWAGNNFDIDGFQVFVYQSASATAYAFGTTPADEMVYEIPAVKRAFILFGVVPDRYYTFGVRAYRVVDTDVNAAGLITTAIVKPSITEENPYRPSANVAFAGNVTGTVSGTAASTVATATGNFNGRNDRIATAVVAPALANATGTIDHVINTDGSADISIEWTWGGVETQIDGFVIYVHDNGTTTPTAQRVIDGNANASETVFYVTPQRRAFILPGVAADHWYTFGIQAYRIVDPDVDANGVLRSSVVQPLSAATETTFGAYRPSSNVPFTGTIGATVSAATVATAATNFNGRNDRKNTTPAAPVILADGTAVDHTINADGAADISFDWTFTGTGDAYDIDGFIVYVRQGTTSAAYTFGTSPLQETTYVVPADRRAFIMYGVPADRYYTFGVRAYRVVDPDVAASGILQSSIIVPSAAGENPYQPATSVAFTGNITGTVNGLAVATVTTAVSNFNGRNDRKSTTPALPTVLTDGTAVDHVTNADGAVDISFEWGFTGTGDAYDIDGFIVYVRQSDVTGAYTFGTSPAQETAYQVPADRRAFILYGVPADRFYTFGVRAYRVVDTDVAAAGILQSAIVKSTLAAENPYRPSTSVSFTGNIGATVSAATVATAATNFNGRNDRLATAVVAPVIANAAAAIDHVLNADGSADISLEWTWGGTEADIDGFVVYVHDNGTTTPTAQRVIDGAANAAEMVYFLTPQRRAFILSGAAANHWYTFGVQAYRIVDPDVNAAGIIRSTIAQPASGATETTFGAYRPSSNVAFTGNVSGTVNNIAAADINVWNAISGTGKPQDNATVGATIGVNLSGQINTGNVGTYIAAGAIGNAYIGNFIQSSNFDGVINASGNITNFGSVGWAIGKAGNAVFSDVKLRGELNGGPFTGFAWPAAGSADGFHLGPSGLMLGNYNTILPSGKRRYLQINSNGNIYAPGFSVVDGDATFSGTLSANTVNTTNIVGAAVTTTYSAASGGNTASVTITVPAGSSSLVVVAYIGAPYFTQVGSGKDAYNVTSIPQGTLYVNGAAQTTQQGTLIWSTASPTVGTYNVQIDRDAASGTMNIAVLLTKR